MSLEVDDIGRASHAPLARPSPHEIAALPCTPLTLTHESQVERPAPSFLVGLSYTIPIPGDHYISLGEGGEESLLESIPYEGCDYLP